ncbi:DMT family transporter [Mammaliicoccus lentus]|uniref:DMT family transporter n=1 Tax=Mammaliicoccus lentus TaxID=42858 RepID=UPI002DB6D6FC|nr:DMT family transporter [Mammaliicoccus lentus]MEB8091944.1 DMT family transporter [Mammaliicoccus lentus]
MENKIRIKGMILAITGASFWGLGGTVSDFLFQYKYIDIDWFVTIRLLFSGILLLFLFKIINKKDSLFSVFKNKNDILQLLFFSIFGMLLVQYSYMASINLGNAAIATLLQYIAPVYIIIWYIIIKQDTFKLFDFLTILLTLSGSFLLLTNGSFNNLIVPKSSIIWGIISGISLAFYTLYVSKLLVKFPSILIVGWSMLISGIFMNFKAPVWDVNLKTLVSVTILFLLFGIVGGTTIAFFFFISSLNYINAKETAFYGTIEPVMAILSSAIWLNVSFLPLQITGIALIIILIFIISLKKEST